MCCIIENMNDESESTQIVEQRAGDGKRERPHGKRRVILFAILGVLSIVMAIIFLIISTTTTTSYETRFYPDGEGGVVPISHVVYTNLYSYMAVPGIIFLIIGLVLFIMGLKKLENQEKGFFRS